MWLRRFDVRSERELCVCVSLVSGREYDLAFPGGSRAAKAFSRTEDARLQERKANTLVAWKTNRRCVGKVVGIRDRFDAN